MIVCNQSNLNLILDILIPILTLFIGMVFIPTAESFKEKYRLKQLKKFVLVSLNQINDQVERQITKFTDTIENISDFNKNDIIPIKNSVTSIKNIVNINEADLFKVLVNKRKGKNIQFVEDYKEIVTTVDFFAESLSLIFEECQKTVADIRQFSEDWNQSQMRFQNYINEFFTYNLEHKIDPDKDLFLKEIQLNKVELQNKYGNEYPNIEVSYLEHIRPIIELTKKYSGDRRAFVLMSESQQSKLAYEQLKLTRRRLKNYLVIANKNIADANIELKKIIDKIE